MSTPAETDTPAWPLPFSSQDWEHMPPAVPAYLRTLRQALHQLQQRLATFKTVVPGVSSSFWRQLILMFAINTLIIAGHAWAQDPNISQRFPIREKNNISPPSVEPPIHECAMAVTVSGFIGKAEVRVFANGGELIGVDKPKHVPAKITLTRALVLGDTITATQTVGSVTSDPSYDPPVPVTNYPTLTTPVVIPDIYECGQVVPVGNLVASTHVEVSDFTPSPPSLLGTGETTGDWDPIVTSKLIAHHQVRAQQIACPTIPTKTVKSALSDPPLEAKTAPTPPPAVSMDVPVIGSEQVVLHNLLVGAQIQLNYGSSPVPDGLATAADNRVADVPPVPPSTPITAIQTLCSPSAPSSPVVATDKPETPILGSPICTGDHYVNVDQTKPGLHVVLLRGGSPPPIGYADGILGTLPLPVAGGVTLNNGDAVSVVQYVSSIFGTFFSDPSNVVTVGCAGGGNVVTQHNDNHRTGAYTLETTLTANAVLARGMRMKWNHRIEGWVNAQPLYVRGVEFPHGVANGLFIATFFTNKVYALNADTGDEEWSTTLVDSDTRKRGLTLGIDSTPVIDVSNHRIYVVFSTKNQILDQADKPDSTKPEHDGKAHTYQDTDLKNLDTAFWVVALDYRNGKELARTLVSASMYRANGKNVSFEAPFHRQHPALLLDNGALYVAFGSIAGSEGFLEYHGWVTAYRAHDLSFQASFNTSRNYAPPRSPYQYNNPDDASGIWQGGGGLAADRDGNIFFLVGNGTADIANNQYGDTFVKLVPTGSSLIPSAFVPSDAAAMALNDADFGAGGALAIPGTDFVIGGGKPGFMYLLERGTMRLRQEFPAATNQYDPSKRDDTWNIGPHLHGSPTYWRGPDATFGNLYVWGEKDFLRRYRFDTITGLVEKRSDRGPVLALEDWHAMPGGMLSLSSNGNRSGTGILWATLPTNGTVNPHPGRLYAFNAETLQPLWDTGLPSLGHWVPPTIADGKVFVGTSSGVVICYELGPEQPNANTAWSPYQPRATSRPMKHALGGQWDESVMTTLPTNTLLALAPPADVSKYAVLNGEGTTAFAAQKGSPNGRLTWTSQDSALEATITIADQPFPEDQKINLTISSDHMWKASDGSSAETSVVKSYTAPDNDGPPWELYKVKHSSGSGILYNVEYIQRVMTQGGLPPLTAPQAESDTARATFTAEYILYKKPNP